MAKIGTNAELPEVGTMHSTNYSDTLICPAEDCKAVAKVPDKAGSVAALQYEELSGRPYEFTSDDVLSTVAAKRNGIGETAIGEFRRAFFSKGQPCFRASPLTKTHGWAIHANKDGHVALLDPNGREFASLLADEAVKKVYAMRTKRL